MKKYLPLLLLACFIGFSGCNKDPVKFEYYRDQPAIVKYSAKLNYMIETAVGTFYAPELAYINEVFMEGDLLWTSFDVDLNNQPDPLIKTASNLHFKQIFSTFARPKTEGTTYYDEPISRIIADIVIIRKLMFFWFYHEEAPREQEYEYLMTYDMPEEINDVPTLYLRARKSNNPSGQNDGTFTCCGFDMSSYIDDYRSRNPASNEIFFNVKFFTGHTDGEDNYRLLNEGFHFRWVVEK